MCWVSAIMDQAAKIPPATWTPPLWHDFTEIIKRLDAIDKKLGQPECHDPKKAEFMKAIEERIKRLEKELHETKEELVSIAVSKP